MNLLLLLLIILFLYLGLSDPPLQCYSHTATAIVTQAAQANAAQATASNGHYSALVTYNTSPYTMENQVPLVSSTPLQFGQTPVIYYNPANPRQISLQRFVPADQRKLLFVIAALVLILFFPKKT